MKVKDFTKIGKQLLPDLTGFVVEKDMVFKSPIGDVLKGLCFERCSDANYFHISVLFLPLYVPREYIVLSFGKRIGNALNWRADNPVLLDDLNNAIRDEAAPFLNKISTWDGVLSFFKTNIEFDKQRINPHYLEAFAYTLIKTGDYSTALESLAEFKQVFENSTTPWLARLMQRTQLIKGKLLQNPGAALAQLEAWKSETISKLGLEKYR